MNLIRVLRKQAGITQQDLAERAGTSQSTIAMYEKGAKSPTLSTVQRLAEALGLEMVASFTPNLTREDHRSIAYHQAVAAILNRNPVAAIARAKRTLQKLRGMNSGAHELLDRWKIWLDLPSEELISKMLGLGLIARDMRQVSPFAGLLSPRERLQILSDFRKVYNP